MKMKFRATVFLFFVLLSVSAFSQQISSHKEPYPVPECNYFPPGDHAPKVKNIILMIGDGMGVPQVYAAITANGGKSNFQRFPVSGFSITWSSDNYVTDSAAGGTALACGKKTKNGTIGMDSEGNAITSILELADENGYNTGLVATCSMTHATPASFIAHQPSRKMDEAIAADYLNTDIDVVIGGGRQFFSAREDKRNLLADFRKKGYEVVFTLDSVNTKAKKVVCLTADNHPPKYAEGRGNMLPDATQKAISILSQGKKGFFLMVEGSQIDWGGHANDVEYVLDEALDFDRAVAQALDFAARDGNTLVIVTADHETGGLTLPAGNLENGTLEARFSTDDHTGCMVPVFAYGPGAIYFSGIFQNTAVFDKMRMLFGF